MKTTSILGSPRKKGNANRVLVWIEEAWQAQDHQVNRINVVDHKVNGCKGCFICKESPDEPGFPQKDDAGQILDQLIDSDIILYASPNYMWGLTAQMKAIIDRHCSLVIGFGTPRWRSLLQGKKMGLVVTCEDAVENNSDLMMEMFKRLADYLKCSHAGALVVPFTTTPDALGDGVKERACVFAKNVLTS